MRKINDYLHLSKREYRGSIFILFLLILLASTRIAVTYYQLNSPTDFSEFKKEIDSFESSVRNNTDSIEENYIVNFSKDNKHYFNNPNLFFFNPNKLDSSGFLKLGLSAKQTRVILNYRRKGGRFYSKKSFEKIYCISPEMYQKLEPFIEVEPYQKPEATLDKSLLSDSLLPKKKQYTAKKENDIVFEINDADTTALKLIVGIGSTFAKRIVAYRDKLGGFFHKKQFKEIYGVDTTIYKVLDKHTVIDSSNIKKININKASFYTLKNFPYLSKSQLLALVNYRDHHGNFTKLSDIKNCVLIDEVTYEKVKMYLKTTD